MKWAAAATPPRFACPRGRLASLLYNHVSLHQVLRSVAANPKGRVLAEALPYIHAYHGKTLVIRFGGHAMADAALMSGFARDVALLWLVGMRPIIVHGGGWRGGEMMRPKGLGNRPQPRHRGNRQREPAGVRVAPCRVQSEPFR